MSGRRGRCAQCGTAFTVPAAADTTAAGTTAATPPRQDRAEADPQYIGVECRVCGTRMFGRPDQVGQPLKCPDCGARTVLPPAPPPKPRNIPAALEGEQYELWDAEDQPLPSELIAAQPQFIPVRCSHCDTLMYATENQVGQTLTCPDCGTKHVVPPAPRPKPKRSVLTSAAETPALDLAADPGERPPVILPPRRQMVYEEERKAELAQALDKARRTGKPLPFDARGRPILPRWPLVTGIAPFLFSRGVPVRWLALSVGFMFAASIVLSGLEAAVAGGMGALYGMCAFAIGIILSLIVLAAACTFVVSIIIESSEGNQRIQYWPDVFDWFANLLYVSVAALVSAFPGWAIAHFATRDSQQVALWIGGSLFVCLPIVLLSQLEINSPWGVLSAKVLASVARCPFSWLLFYLEVAAIVAVCGAVTVFAARSGAGIALWPVPLYVVGLLLFARLLGRLGWRLAEALPADEEPAHEAPLR